MKHTHIKQVTIFVLIITVLLLNCETNTVNNSTEDTQYSIYLTGSVRSKNGDPIVGAIARLNQLGYSDTTDENGSYTIKYTDTAIRIQQQGIDTLEISKEQQLVETYPITEYIDTLPVLLLTQRDIYGYLDTNYKNIGRIEAVVTGDNIDDSLGKNIELGYNAAAHAISGFIYSIHTLTTTNNSVYVNVYNPDGLFIGRSLTVDYTSIFGDINIPTFSPNNAIPYLSIVGDTTLSINDSIRVYASATDSFGGQIVKWEMCLEENDTFITASNIDTILNLSSIEDTSYNVVIRVTDNDNNIVSDTLVIKVLEDLPTANAGLDTSIFISDTVKLKGSNSVDILGEIVKYEWSITGDTNFIEVLGGDTQFIASNLNLTNGYSCILKVTDDDGGFSFDTVNITKAIPDTLVINTPSISGIWGPNKVYKLLIDADVGEGLKLEILPGTSIIANFGINITGSLIANGNDSLKTIFTSLSDSTMWNGFLVGGLWASGYLELNNIKIKNAKTGIRSFGCSKPVDAKLTGCIIENCTKGIKLDFANDPNINTINVYNNVFNNNDMVINFDDYNSSDSLILNFNNNILINSGTLFVTKGSAENMKFNRDVSYNCFYNYSISVADTSVSPISLNNFINEDPMFIDLQNSDYNLDVNSPCIGAGVSGTDIGIYSTWKGY